MSTLSEAALTTSPEAALPLTVEAPEIDTPRDRVIKSIIHKNFQNFGRKLFHISILLEPRKRDARSPNPMQESYKKTEE